MKGNGILCSPSITVRLEDKEFRNYGFKFFFITENSD
jgi:hypothetical protein